MPIAVEPAVPSIARNRGYAAQRYRRQRLCGSRHGPDVLTVDDERIRRRALSGPQPSCGTQKPELRARKFAMPSWKNYHDLFGPAEAASCALKRREIYLRRLWLG